MISFISSWLPRWKGIKIWNNHVSNQGKTIQNGQYLLYLLSTFERLSMRENLTRLLCSHTTLVILLRVTEQTSVNPKSAFTQLQFRLFSPHSYTCTAVIFSKLTQCICCMGYKAASALKTRPLLHLVHMKGERSKQFGYALPPEPSHFTPSRLVNSFRTLYQSSDTCQMLSTAHSGNMVSACKYSRGRFRTPKLCALKKRWSIRIDCNHSNRGKAHCKKGQDSTPEGLRAIYMLCNFLPSQLAYFRLFSSHERRLGMYSEVGTSTWVQARSLEQTTGRSNSAQSQKSGQHTQLKGSCYFLHQRPTECSSRFKRISST